MGRPAAPQRAAGKEAVGARRDGAPAFLLLIESLGGGLRPARGHASRPLPDGLRERECEPLDEAPRLSIRREVIDAHERKMQEEAAATPARNSPDR